MNDPRRGIKLIELMVIVLVVGVALGIFVPAQLSHNTGGRRTQCQNNLRNIGLSLVQFSIAKGHYPNAGTFYDDPDEHGGDPAESNIYRAITDPASLDGEDNPCLHSWVRDILPYLDNQEFYNAFDGRISYLSKQSKGTSGAKGDEIPYHPNLQITSTAISILRCPSDPTSQPGQGNLSYVVNGGFARWYPIPTSWIGGAKDGQSQNGEPLHWADGSERMTIGRGLGVMFLGTHTGDQPWDMTIGPKDVTDGQATTLMVGENTLAGYSKGNRYSGGLPTNWGCPLPNFTMFVGSDDVCRSARSDTDCLAGQLRPNAQGETGAGWEWANHPGSFERINYGLRLQVEGSSPFLSSDHSGGTNTVFCDGSVRYLSDSIDGKVFARIITPAGETLPQAIRQGKLGGSDMDQ